MAETNKLMELLGSNAAKGAYTGAGIGSLLAIINSIALDRERTKAFNTKDRTDKRTILLRLPSRDSDAKYAEEKPRVVRDKCVNSNKKVSADVRGRLTPGRKPSCQYVHDMTHGRGEAEKTAFGLFKTKPYREAFDVLKFFAGAGAGYMTVKKVHDKAIQRRLERDEELARTEFIGALGGHSGIKRAADGALSGAEKQAKLDVMNVLALMTLLGAGGSAYVTKRMLDANMENDATRSYNPPKIRRIVLKSESSGEPDQEISPKTAQALLAVKIAELSGTRDLVVGPELVKAAQASSAALSGLHNTQPSELLRQRGLPAGLQPQRIQPAAVLSRLFESQPEYANGVIRKFLKSRQSIGQLGFIDKLPGRTRDWATSALSKLMDIPAVGRHVRGRAATGLSDALAGMSKGAVSLPASVLASFLGSVAAKGDRRDEADSGPAALAGDARTISISADDEHADTVRLAKQKKLEEAIALLQQDGLI